MIIKFRFWNIAAQRFEPPDNFVINSNGKVIPFDPDINPDHIVAQQFSGLLSNGVEIYEGDIIKRENYAPSVVYFINGRFCLDDGYLLSSSQFLLDRLEIVGHIFNSFILK